MKKYIFPEDKINIKFLSGMNIDLKTKRKLQRQAKNWLKYIKWHSEIMHDLNDNNYHNGERDFINSFFFDKFKPIKRKK